jgi:hypothetical protein
MPSPCRTIAVLSVAVVSSLFGLQAQSLTAPSWDPGKWIPEYLGEKSEKKLQLTFQERNRFEDRTGNGFGASKDTAYDLMRTRVGLTYTPVNWFKVSAMMQDTRSPLYGPNAPSTLRDPADLQEAYVEIGRKASGLQLSVGREMLIYGDGRLIGVPDWSSLSRTYDHARVGWTSSLFHSEVLVVSPVKIRIGEFNRPVLGDRVWGTYNTFPKLHKSFVMDAYFLRHEQNRPGGFTGGKTSNHTDRLGVNTFGFRTTGPIARGFRYSMEGAVQNGMVGPATHRAGGWVSSISRKQSVFGKTLENSVEYKFASGSKNPSNTAASGTFDQLYAANHDRFGHADLLGWRNLHDLRTLSTFGATKKLAINFMFNDLWLASARDSLYNGSGKSIARSSTGSAGRHVGEEADCFATYKIAHFQFGAGYARLFTGHFLNATTPGVNPNYAYVFQSFGF